MFELFQLKNSTNDFCEVSGKTEATLSDAPGVKEDVESKSDEIERFNSFLQLKWVFLMFLL